MLQVVTTPAALNLVMGRGCARFVGTVDARVAKSITHGSWAWSGCLLACVGGLAASNVHLSDSTSVALLWSSDSTPIQTQDVGSDEPNYLLIDLVAGMRRVDGNSGSVHHRTDFAVADWMAVCHAQVFRIHTPVTM